jgi:uncharacterized repeat protein (TIGR02543 family)
MRQTLWFSMRGAAVVVLAMVALGCPNPLQMGQLAPPLGRIVGKVLTQEQADNSGITVTAELTDGIRSVSIQRMVSGALAAGSAIAAQATTDASGAYALIGLPPGTYTVNASSRDALEKAVTTTVNVSAGSTVEAPLLRLTRTGEIEGTVTLEGESNHLGIVVFIAGTSYSAMTAASGNFKMSFVPAGKGYTLVASKIGYDSAITNVDVAIGRTTRVAPLVLAPHITPPTTGSVSGTVLLEGAASNAGVFVYLAGTSHISVTDDPGSFNLTGVAPGTYTLVASKAGYTAASCSASVAAGSDWSAGELILYSLGPFFVMYNGNGAEGGSVPVDATGYLAGTSVTVLGNSGKLVRAGFNFAGWNTQTDGSGTTYTQGQTFAMGNADATLYASWSPAPVDITGFWDLMVNVGGQEYGPMQFYIRQEETILHCAMADFTLSGSINGLDVVISGYAHGMSMTYTGTISGSGIAGTVTATDWPPGTFSMVRSSLPFGHFDILGSLHETPIDTSTEYATAARGQTVTTHQFNVRLALGGTDAEIIFYVSEPPSGHFGIIPDVPENQPGVMAVMVWQDGNDLFATGGVVDISYFDSTRIVGTFNLAFPDDTLTGSFDLTFNGSGSFTVGGTWHNIDLPTATLPADYSWMSINTRTTFTIGFWDDQQSFFAWFNVSGDLVQKHYEMPYDAWFDAQWSLHGGSSMQIMDTSGGYIDIDELSATGIRGSYRVSFTAGGTVRGSFDVKF